MLLSPLISRLRMSAVATVPIISLLAASPLVAGQGSGPEKVAADAPATALADAAGEVLAGIEERVEADEPITPEFIDLLTRWTRSKAFHEMAAARDRARRVDVAQRYLESLRVFSRWGAWATHFRAEGTPLAYALREAEFAVARAAADRPDPLPQDDPPRSDAAAESAEEAKARAGMLEAARALWKSLEQRVEADEPLTPEFVDLLCGVSRRLYFSEVAGATAKDARLKSANAHLVRMQHLHDLIDKRFRAGLDVSRVQLAQATYFLREAGLWVARESKK
jgi:hypothetical protein